jgi:queuine tRNA-ribosyltransferase
MAEKHFNLLKKTGAARAGELNTAHGKVLTPAFMPVGSQATVRTLTPEEITSMGFNMILANTYHLYLRPGVEIIKEMGGLHKFMGWQGAMLTDSGGYQVFSLSPFCKITDEGAKFRSHIDGSEHFLTPELAVQYQEALGADVIMVLDECSAFGDSPEKVAKAMERTHRWAERCIAAHKTANQSLYGIVQGGIYPELREQSSAFLSGLDFPGYAIGGLSVGETKEVMLNILGMTTSHLPELKPRYLMGVGAPEDLVEGVARGVDLFDCALPTRVARNGALFTRQGRVNIRRASFSKLDKPLDETCDCYTCRTFTAAYLNHLFRAEELLGLRLATIHNLRFLKKLMEDIRRSILEDKFESFRQDFLAVYKPTDEAVRVEQKGKWLKERGGGKAE